MAAFSHHVLLAVAESSSWQGSGCTAGLCSSPPLCLATTVPMGETRAQGFV